MCAYGCTLRFSNTLSRIVVSDSGISSLLPLLATGLNQIRSADNADQLAVPYNRDAFDRVFLQ